MTLETQNLELPRLSNARLNTKILSESAPSNVGISTLWILGFLAKFLRSSKLHTVVTITMTCRKGFSRLLQMAEFMLRVVSGKLLKLVILNQELARHSES